MCQCSEMMFWCPIQRKSIQTLQLPSFIWWAINFLSLQIWVSEKQWGQKQEVLHCNKYFTAWTRWSYCDSLCFCLMRRRLVYCHLAFVCSERQSKFLILTSTGVFFVSNLSSKIIMTKCDVTDVKSLSYQFTYEVLQAGLVEEKGGGGQGAGSRHDRPWSLENITFSPVE